MTRLLIPARDRAKLVVFMTCLAVRQLRDDPARALRLAARLALRAVPARLQGPRLRRLTVPRPRDPRREAADLRELLAAPQPQRDLGVPVELSAGDGGMRVMCLVTNALPRTNAGYTVRTHKIAAMQRDEGLDTHVVTRLGYPLSQGLGDTRPLVEVDGVPYHRLLPWLPPRSAAALVRRSADHAERLVRELRPDVLHAVSGHLNAAVALELRRRHELWTVYEVRGFLEDSWLSRDPSHSPDHDFYRLTRELETRCMLAADRVVTLGEAMREEIVGRGIAAEKIVVVPNAVDDGFLRPLPDGRGLRARLGIAPGAVTIGLTSSFFGYEGIDTLIDAAALLRDRGTPVTLLLVGDGPERGALERRAGERGLNDAPAQVIFTGRVPMGSVREYHAVLDVFAVPRRADRVCQLVTPLKPVEAMAGGIPVIASDVKALREIVEPGVTGELTVPEDPEAWANSLATLIYSHEKRRRIGQAAREWVKAERTWRAVTARYREAYLPGLPGLPGRPSGGIGAG